MADACVACHTNVKDQITNQSGTHGKFANSGNCVTCHAEHKGRDFDPLKTALLNFDHNQTGFKLADAHAKAVCADCHQNNRYDQARPECVSCHSEPALHSGLLGTDCSACHTAIGWKPALMDNKPYNHELTSFSLAKHARNYQGQPIFCSACHTPVTIHQPDLNTCSSCHAQQDAAFMQKHTARYGIDCTQCHDGKDKMQGFQHAQVFLLDGKHAQIACDQCHANQKFQGTPSACAACHQEPVIHAGAFGLKCQYCHNSDAWRPAFLKLHSFPLDHGGKGEVECKTCHTGAYSHYTCYTCHDHQPDEIARSHAKAGIPAAKLPDCVSCHMDGLVHQTSK